MNPALVLLSLTRTLLELRKTIMCALCYVIKGRYEWLDEEAHRTGAGGNFCPAGVGVRHLPRLQSPTWTISEPQTFQGAYGGFIMWA